MRKAVHILKIFPNEIEELEELVALSIEYTSSLNISQHDRIAAASNQKNNNLFVSRKGCLILCITSISFLKVELESVVIDIHMETIYQRGLKFMVVKKSDFL